MPTKNETAKKFYYPDVPELGNVAVSRHALDRLDTSGNGDITPEGSEITWRELKGVRVVYHQQADAFSWR